MASITCVCACKNKYMHICEHALNMRYFSTTAGTCCGNNLHPARNSVHLFPKDPYPEDAFDNRIFALCVSCMKKVTLAHAAQAWGWTEMLDSKKAQARCQTIWPSEQLLWKSSVSQAPLCSPQPPIAAAPHDYSLARTQSPWRDSVCLSEGNLM